MVGKRSFPFRMTYFHGAMSVSFREGILVESFWWKIMGILGLGCWWDGLTQQKSGAFKKIRKKQLSYIAPIFFLGGSPQKLKTARKKPRFSFCHAEKTMRRWNVFSKPNRSDLLRQRATWNRRFWSFCSWRLVDGREGWPQSWKHPLLFVGC